MFNVHWQDPSQTILRIDATDKRWRWDRFDRAAYEAFWMMREVRYGVVAVLNLSDFGNDVPEAAVPQIEKLFKKAPRNLAKLIIVSDDELVQWHFTLTRNKSFMVVNDMTSLMH